MDRAFVLASGTMDRHLTYVAMTRHRDGARLYAGRAGIQGHADRGPERRGLSPRRIEGDDARLRARAMPSGGGSPSGLASGARSRPARHAERDDRGQARGREGERLGRAETGGGRAGEEARHVRRPETRFRPGAGRFGRGARRAAVPAMETERGRTVAGDRGLRQGARRRGAHARPRPADRGAPKGCAGESRGGARRGAAGFYARIAFGLAA